MIVYRVLIVRKSVIALGCRQQWVGVYLHLTLTQHLQFSFVLRGDYTRCAGTVVHYVALAFKEP